MKSLQLQYSWLRMMPRCTRVKRLAPIAATLCSKGMLRTANYIDGGWQDSVTGRTFPSFEPSSGNILAQVTRSNDRDVDTAVAAAHRALPEWRSMPAPFRANFLYRIAKL